MPKIIDLTMPIGKHVRWPVERKLLGDLAQRKEADGFHMHYFSNYPVWYRWIEERLGLSRHASWSFVSCNMGVRKPSSQAFQQVLDTLGAEAGDCVLIDDQEGNTSAAADHGMDAVRFRDAAGLAVALRGLGFPV